MLEMVPTKDPLDKTVLQALRFLSTPQRVMLDKLKVQTEVTTLLTMLEAKVAEQDLQEVDQEETEALQ
jgi:hypothetical protein